MWGLGKEALQLRAWTAFWKQRQVDLCKVKASLVYVASYEIARATKRDPILINKIEYTLLLERIQDESPASTWAGSQTTYNLSCMGILYLWPPKEPEFTYIPTQRHTYRHVRGGGFLLKIKSLFHLKCFKTSTTLKPNRVIQSNIKTNFNPQRNNQI